MQGSWTTAPEGAPARRSTPVAELFDRALGIYRRAWLPIVISYAVFQIPVVVLNLASTSVQMRPSNGQPLGYGTITTPDQLIATSIATVFSMAVALGLGTFGLAIVSILAARAERGERLSAWTAMREIGRSFSPIGGFVLIMLGGWALLAVPAVALIVSVASSIPPGGTLDGSTVALSVLITAVVVVILAFVGVRFCLGVPAIVINDLGPLDALRRSWVLLQGRAWRTFYLLMLGALVVGLPSVILNPLALPGVFRGMMTGSIQAYAVIILVSGLVTTVVGPIMPILLTVLYSDYSSSQRT
jgi:hypothetical protein